MCKPNEPCNPKAERPSIDAVKTALATRRASLLQSVRTLLDKGSAASVEHETDLAMMCSTAIIAANTGVNDHVDRIHRLRTAGSEEVMRLLNLVAMELGMQILVDEAISPWRKAVKTRRAAEAIEFGRTSPEILAQGQLLHDQDRAERRKKLESWYRDLPPFRPLLPPLVQGGQGRTSDSLLRDGSWLVVLLVIACALAGLGGVAWMVTALK